MLPVIHVSAASIQTGDIITGLDAGADAYLMHPVDPDVLVATLRTLMRVRDTERALRESEARLPRNFRQCVGADRRARCASSRCMSATVHLPS